MAANESPITQALVDLQGGDRSGWDRLMTLLYQELRKLAAHYLAGEAHVLTLQPTALAHEAYLRLVQDSYQDWRGRAHFFGAAANAIRRVLVEEARRRNALKRGAERRRVELEPSLTDAEPSELTAGHSILADPLDIEALDGALAKLAEHSPRQARVVEMRFFGGMTVEDVAQVLAVAPETVKRDWRLARAWLSRELKEHS
jgi:RNA polymerase sigma factor (TIGR02999 family)